MKRLTISRKTLLAMLGLSIPSLLIFTVLTLTATANILRGNSTREIEELADHSVQSLQQLVRHSKTTLMTIAATQNVRDYLSWRTGGEVTALPQVLSRLEESFLDFQQLDPSIQAIRLLDEEGNVLVKVREGVVIPRRETLPAEQSLPLVESLKNRDFFQGTMVLEQGEIWTSNMERGKVEGEEYWCPAMVRFSTPLFLEDGRRAGALIINVWGETAGRLINQLISPEEGAAFLVERNLNQPSRNGIYLFHQDRTCEFGNQTGSEITAFQQFPDELTSAWMSQHQGVSFHPDTGDILAHRFYSPYNDSRHGWVLVINASRDFFLAPLANLKQRILLSTFAVLLFTVVAAGFFARTLTRPLQAVIDGTHRLSMDLGYRIRIGSRDEVGFLADEINRMADTLQSNLKEQAHVEQQICHTEKLASVGEMAAGLAHELNTPLGNIQALASLAGKELDGGDLDTAALRQDLADITDQTAKCSRILSGLLSFARKQHPSLALQDINTLLEEALRLVRIRQEKEDIRIDFSPDPALPYVRVDGHQIQQVFVNLLLNAFDAMPDGGTVHITCADEEQRLAVRIRDEGDGIPPENLRKIFDPFFTTKEVGKGTGLGLSVSYGIVQSQGGTIEVESPPGQGATFTLRLPKGVY
ncbi:MAG: ATP-binding protein [Geoalkalibacter sp.]|jgi:two-component system NtrC family sensor kinase|uniref:sensor histidine kinase n=1 Tax=Geoalkalibacter sp. TaxID=3041440 RepID=UPI003D09EE81